MSDRYGFEADNWVVAAYTGDDPREIAKGLCWGPRLIPARKLGLSPMKATTTQLSASNP